MVALVVTICLNKWFTMKNIILGSLFVGTLGLLVIIATPGVIAVTAGLFLVQGARCVLNEVLYSFVSVVSADEVRTRSVMLL